MKIGLVQWFLLSVLILLVTLPNSYGICHSLTRRRVAGGTTDGFSSEALLSTKYELFLMEVNQPKKISVKHKAWESTTSDSESKTLR